MNPKQFEGLRLLVTPFPQQQFNATADRRSDKPSLGVTCFECQDFTEFEQRAAYFDGDPVIPQPELRGEAVFFGKGRCGECHGGPIFSDNFMHDLQTERFFAPVLVAGRMAAKDGPIKTFPLRGIKESPPYLHDGRLLTLDDTVEFFNLVLGTKLSDAEKADLVAYLYTL